MACRGKAGVSDTFASALWVTDALFSLARAGVDGVNMHTLPDAAYELFAFSRQGGRWQAQVRPVYYGLQLFAQAAPPVPGCCRCPAAAPTAGLSVWATAGAGHDACASCSSTRARRKRKTVTRAAAAPARARRRPSSACWRPSVARQTRRDARRAQLRRRAPRPGGFAAPEVARVPATGARITLSVPRASAALVTVG